MRDPTKLTILISADELDGGYIAEVNELPGCLTQGNTIEETLTHLSEAIQGVLNTPPTHNQTISRPPRWLITELAIIATGFSTFVTWSPNQMPWPIRLTLVILTAALTFTLGALTLARTLTRPPDPEDT